MTARVLILAGGWRGHEPRAVARSLSSALRAYGLDVATETTLAALDDDDRLAELDLLIPLWTMGRLGSDRQRRICDAVSRGTGLGGVHGSADAFRAATDYQFVLGGQFVAHPGGDTVRYTVNPTHPPHPITDGLTPFEVTSERYYMHVDPSNDVIATTGMPTSDGKGDFDMPVAWTRRFGKGRVFYTAIGHSLATFSEPSVQTLAVRGLLWAAGALPGARYRRGRSPDSGGSSSPPVRW